MDAGMPQNPFAILVPGSRTNTNNKIVILYDQGDIMGRSGLRLLLDINTSSHPNNDLFSNFSGIFTA